MKLEATKREAGNASTLRRSGRLPAVLYNAELNQNISVELRAFDKAFRAQGTSSLIDLEVDGTVHPVLVKAVQMSKRRRVPIHVDFYAITAGQAVEVNVPIQIVGTAVGVKDHGGLLDVQRREVRINILPRLIPSHVELDVSALEMGESRHIADLIANLPPEAEIVDELDLAIVTVVAPRLAEESEDEEIVEPTRIGEEAADEDNAEE